MFNPAIELLMINLKLIIFLPFVFVVFVSFTQNTFVVISIEGHVRSEVSGALKPGMKIKKDTRIMFNTPKARVLLIGDNGDTYQLKSDTLTILKYVVCESIMSEPHRFIKHSHATLASSLDKCSINAIGDVLTVTIPEDHFLNDSQHYFFVVFKYGEHTICRKVIMRNSQLVLLRNTILKYAGTRLPLKEVKDVTLYYHDGDITNSVALFNLSFIEATSLIKDESYLISTYMALGILSKKEIVKKSVIYFHEAYGEFDDDQLVGFVSSVVLR